MRVRGSLIKGGKGDLTFNAIHRTLCFPSLLAAIKFLQPCLNEVKYINRMRMRKYFEGFKIEIMRTQGGKNRIKIRFFGCLLSTLYYRQKQSARIHKLPQPLVRQRAGQVDKPRPDRRAGRDRSLCLCRYCRETSRDKLVSVHA